VSHPDVDVLVALAQAEPNVLGARMTGGGCGGAILFLAQAGRAREVGARLVTQYRATTGQPGALLVPAPLVG
jgi:galactokinase